MLFLFYALVLILVFAVAGFWQIRLHAMRQFSAQRLPFGLTPDSADVTQGRWHSQPGFHGGYAAWLILMTCLLILLIGWVVILAIDPPGKLGEGALMLAMLGASGMIVARLHRTVRPDFPARLWVERFIRYGLLALAALSALITTFIFLVLLVQAVRFFADVPAPDFLFGMEWSPLTALRADQSGQSGQFGAVPIFAGTLLVTAIAMIVAIPNGLLIAAYLSVYASARRRAWVKPVLEILAGIPTVVYGFFALILVGPAIAVLAGRFGLEASVQSALAAGLVMGVMIIPLIASLGDDVLSALPYELREGALAMGTTRTEMLSKILLPPALPGLSGTVLLAVSRALGETMIVLMAAGQTVHLSGNPLDAVTTVTVQIVSLLTGEQMFDNPRTLAAFALGLVLFILSLALNMLGSRIVQRMNAQARSS